MLLVNILLNVWSLNMAYTLISLLKKCVQLLQMQKLHTFFSKNTSELDILTRTVDTLTTNELVKLTMLWTTGPWLLIWEDLYADDIVIITESLKECVKGLLTWKEAMEEEGLRVNAEKTKIMICGTGLDRLQSSDEFPCAVCRTGAGSNSIFCNDFKHWVHKKCSGLKRWQRTLITDVYGTRELHAPWMADYRGVQVGPDKLEVVASFCYLGDMLSAAGGCELSTTTHVKTAWNKFKEQLPVLSSWYLSFKTRGCVCAERNASCQWDLAIDKAKLPTSAAEWLGNDQTDLQCQAARHCHHQVQWATCAAWH